MPGIASEFEAVAKRIAAGCGQSGLAEFESLAEIAVDWAAERELRLGSRLAIVGLPFLQPAHCRPGANPIRYSPCAYQGRLARKHPPLRRGGRSLLGSLHKWLG